MEAIRAELPVGITVDQIADQPHVVEHSIKEFVKAFGEALAIVLVVSFLSLGFRTGSSWRCRCRWCSPSSSW